MSELELRGAPGSSDTPRDEAYKDTEETHPQALPTENMEKSQSEKQQKSAKQLIDLEDTTHGDNVGLNKATDQERDNDRVDFPKVAPSQGDYTSFEVIQNESMDTSQPQDGHEASFQDTQIKSDAVDSMVAAIKMKDVDEMEVGNRVEAIPEGSGSTLVSPSAAIVRERVPGHIITLEDNVRASQQNDEATQHGHVVPGKVDLTSFEILNEEPMDTTTGAQENEASTEVVGDTHVDTSEHNKSDVSEKRDRLDSNMDSPKPGKIPRMDLTPKKPEELDETQNGDSGGTLAQSLSQGKVYSADDYSATTPVKSPDPAAQHQTPPTYNYNAPQSGTYQNNQSSKDDGRSAQGGDVKIDINEENFMIKYNVIKEKEDNSAGNGCVTRSQTAKQASSTGSLLSRMLKGAAETVGGYLGTYESPKENTNEDNVPDVIDLADDDEYENKEQETLSVENYFKTILSQISKDEILVRFHVLVSPDFAYSTSKSRAFIMGLEKLRPDPREAWKEPCAIMTKVQRGPKKHSLNNYVHVTDFIRVPRSQVIGKSHEYKYVFVENMDSKDRYVVYEKLTNARASSNRVLHIPPDFESDYFDQYDDVMLNQNVHDRIPQRKIATQLFLPNLTQMVKDNEVYEMAETVSKIRQVFYCHEDGIFFVAENEKWRLNHGLNHLKKYCASTNYETSCCVEVADLLVQKLFNLLEKALKDLTACTNPQNLQVTVFLALLYFSLLEKIPSKIPLPTKDQYLLLAEALEPTIDGSTGTQLCQKQEAVSNIISSPTSRKYLATAVESGINDILEEYGSHLGEHLSDWIKFLPMTHFLRDFKEPISLAYKQKDKKEKYWGFFGVDVVKYHKICSTTRDTKSLVSHHFQELQLFSTVDPVIKYSYIYALTEAEFFILLQDEEQISFFPLNLLLTRASVLVRSRMADAEMLKSLSRIIMSVTDEMKAQNLASTLLDSLEIEKSFMLFFHGIMKNIDAVPDEFKKSLQKCLDMAVAVFQMVDVVKEHVATDPSRQATSSKLNKTNNVASIIDQTLKWIDESVRGKENILRKKMFFWSELCKQMAPLGEDFLPPIYQKVVTELDSNNANKENILDAFTNTEKTLFPFVHDSLERAALEILSSQTSQGIIDRLVNYAMGGKTQKQRLAKLLSTGLSSSWSSLDTRNDANILLFSLKQDTYFSTILAYEEKEPGLIDEYFPNESRELIRKILEVFSKNLTSLINGDMNIGIFNNILINSSPKMMWKRYQQAEQLNGMSIEKLHDKGFNNLQDILNCTQKEIEAYNHYQEQSVTFLQIFISKGCDFKLALDSFPTQEVLDGYTISAVREMTHSQNLEPIAAFLKLRRSKVFRDIIDKKTTKGKTKNQDNENVVDSDFLCTLIIEEVVTPAIDEFTEIAEELGNCETSLEKVSELFASQRKDLKEVEMELAIIEELLDTRNKDWSFKVFNKIRQYFKMSEYKKIGETINTAKSILKVTSTFPEVEKILKACNKDESFFEAPLSSLSDEDIKFGSIFDKWKPEYLEALVTLEKCQNLLNWLKDSKNMNSYQEFKVFMDLASISAGEEDMEVDRVIVMQSSVKAYSALIFDLKPDATLPKFLDACDQLNKDLELDPKLPDKLLDTNRHLAWIKTIKERHGSVETSSLQQVDAINKTGVYKIGNWSSENDTQLQLTFQQVEGQVGDEYKKKLTEANLHELRSKLMLISKSDENKISVDKFVQTLVQVERLKFAGLQLHRAGCNLYQNISFRVHCNANKKVKMEVNFGGNTGLLSGSLPLEHELPVLADFLEKCLNDWKVHLDELRSKYSSLNFFRTDQLVELSYALASLLNGKDLSRASKMILDSLVEDADSGILKGFLENINKSFVDVDMDETEVVEMTGDDLLERLKKEYSMDEDEAKAAIMANIGESNMDDLFQWYMTNSLEGELIENLSKEFDEAKAREAECKENLGAVDKPTFSEFTKVLVEKANEAGSNLLKKLTEIWSCFLGSVETVESSDFLNFEHIGEALESLYNENRKKVNRAFPRYFKSGKPNLVLCPEEDIHKTVLYFYLDQSKPLPKMDEVLICNKDTTQEQVELICRRAFSDRLGKIYCVLYADILDFSTSMHIENLFLNMEIENRDYQLVFLCRKGGSQHSSLATALEKNKAEVPQFKQIDILRKHIEKHLTREAKTDPTHMRLITSARSGMGKSLCAQRTAERFGTQCETLQLHEKEVDHEDIISRWFSSIEDRKTSKIYHIDITQAVIEGDQDLLFQLVILNGVQDRKGRVWTCDKKDLYLFEKTKKSNVKTVRFEDLLPSTTCLSPMESLEWLNSRQENPQLEDISVFSRNGNLYQLLDHKKFLGATFQRPVQYLQKYEANENLDKFYFLETSPEGSHKSCLQTLLAHSPVQDPSYGELTNFASFLNVQLSSCEKSTFCSLGQIDRDWANARFKNFVTKFMILMAKDFATRSLDVSDESEGNLRPEILNRRKWESSSHPYIFFNDDGVTMSFFGFWKDEQLNLLDPQTKAIIERNIMSGNLYQLLKRQEDRQIPMFNYHFDNLSEEMKLKALCRVLGVEKENIVDPDTSYKLTSDNVLKILAIYMRFKCNIPVIIMGETGSGKTRLIKYLCYLQRGDSDVENMQIIKVHGGITASIIHKKVEKAIDLAARNKAMGINLTVLFFDEANTTSAIGTIKEVMVDRLNNGKPIPENSTLQFVAAINPYREHSEEMIRKLEGAGLGYHIKAENTKDMLGAIPLRKLVYRVQALPLSLFPLVWDFGVLSPENERKYVLQMVNNMAIEFSLSTEEKDVLVSSLCKSQGYMRSRRDECSFVSLRDVERMLIVFRWLYKVKSVLFPQLDGYLDEKFANFGDFGKACLLSLGISYYVRLESGRADYSHQLQMEVCRNIPNLDQEYDYLTSAVQSCQDLFVDELTLDSCIAKNDALKENVWMMVICAELNIPLFLVGKPGSSKSLAKTVVGDVMQGQNSYSSFFRNFKEIHMVSFQCSPIATSEGIVGTFRQCQKYQEKKHLDKFASVVILDEVGLAEDSPKMPLKALHPLLEDGCVDDEEPAPHKKVSFVGISNWALDPAKMNRGILLSRAPPHREDLIKIGKEIGEGTRTGSLTDHLIPDLADGYLAVYKEQEREYFGLRDFYSLVKMITACAKNNRNVTPNYNLIQFCVKRNFGGFFGNFHPAEVFMRQMKCVTRTGRDVGVSERVLIQESLSLKPKYVKQQSRYVLLLTKNNAALRIIQMPGMFEDAKRTVLFGSSFPKDQEYTQICANINRIKICMEMGTQVVLYNMDNLYESLYDALNQNYVHLGGNRYVDLGLGTHRVKCRVSPNFRLILVAEDKDVFEKFPIPLINRLEKHYLGMETIMPSEYAGVVEILRQWVTDFCRVDVQLYIPMDQEYDPSAVPVYQQYQVADVFVGYHDDVIPGIISQLLQNYPGQTEEHTITSCKELLLRCATPDSILRLKDTKLAEEAEEMFQRYFINQTHDSLSHFIQSLNGPQFTRSLIEVTTHSRLLTTSSKTELATSLQISLKQIDLLSLQQFGTEEEFRKKAFSFFQNMEKSNDSAKRILITQIEAGTSTSGNLVECAKFVIQELVSATNKESQFNVILIVQLPRIAGGCYAGYPGQPWTSVHIDELRTPERRHPMAVKMMKDRSIHDIIKREVENKDGILSVEELIEGTIPKAASMLKGGNPKRQMERIDKFLIAFKSIGPFRTITMNKLVELLSKEEETVLDSQNWLSKMAVYNESLKEGLTFRAAVWLHLSNHIAPSLAHILSIIDANDNLDTLEQGVGFKTDLFLRIYSDLNIVTTFCPRDIKKTNEVKIENHGHNDFKVDLPFSWVLVSYVDTCLPRIETLSLAAQVINSAEMGKHFIISWQSNKEEMEVSYLVDFVRIKIQTNTDEEYDVLTKFLKVVAKEKNKTEAIQNNAGELTTPVPDIHGPADFHMVYEEMKDRLTWYTAIVTKFPEIVSDVGSKITDRVKRIDAIALKEALRKMEPKFSEFNEDRLRDQWIMEVQNIQPLIEQMLKLNIFEDGADIMVAVRSNWTQVLVLKMFLHHVTPSGVDPQLKKSVLSKVKLLWLALRDADFRNIKTFNNTVQMLKKINLEAAKLHFAGGESSCVRCGEIPQNPVILPCTHVGCEQCLVELYGADNAEERRCPGRKCKSPNIPSEFVIKTSLDAEESVKKHAEFRTSLNLFFMDLLTTFCFGTAEQPPEQKILEELLKFATVKDIGGGNSKKKTKELSPFEDHGIDSSPVVRSFILQLCLKIDKSLVQEHIQSFFEHKRNYLESDEDIIEFCQLYINCVEDTIIHKVYSSSNDNSRTIAVLQSLNILNDYQNFDKMLGLTIESLDAVAHLRFALRQVAEVLVQYLEDPQLVERNREKQALLNTCVQFVSSGSSKTVANFLVKEISLMHRSDAANEIKNSDYKALLPSEIQEADEEEQKPDMFLIHGFPYTNIRDLLSKAMVTNDYKELTEFLENNQGLASNKISTSLILSAHHLRSFEETKDHGFETFLEEHRQIWYRTPKIQNLFALMSSKNLGWLQLSGDESQRLLDISQLVFRMMVIMSGIQTPRGFQTLLLEMLTNPGTLAQHFLPTMPHDLNFEVLSTLKLGTKYYLCPNNHLYAVGDCGEVVMQRTCIDCGAMIGGAQYRQPAAGNREAGAGIDQTKPGYILGQPGGAPEGVRELTVLETTVVRLVLHCGLLGACVQNKEAITDLCKPSLDIQEFLIQHVNNGVISAAQQLGQSQDDIFVLLHTIVSRIEQETGGNLNIPSTHEERITWEKSFVEVIVRPCVTQLEKEKDEMRKLVDQDDEMVTGKLHQILYSKVEDGLDTVPHTQQLWQVRHRVTADTLLQWLISTDRQTCAPNLAKFLQKLDVTQHLGNLPQILELQKLLSSRFHRRVSLSDLENMSVSDFILTRFPEEERVRVIALADVFLSTWNCVKVKLQKYGGQLALQLNNLPVKVFEIPLTADNSPAAVLFPSSHGTGLCSFALTRFLIETQNQLVSSDLPSIPPTTAGSIHMAEMTRAQVQLLLLAHTRYTLQVSAVTKEEYDVQAMERHIAERFVRGRPRLLDSQADLPHVQFLEDRGNEEDEGLKKIVEQKVLSNNIQHQLETDFKNLPDLCEFLNSVLTAREFLATTGGHADAPLLKYLQTLHLWTGDGAGAVRHLQLCHVDALKDFLYLVRAQRMIRNGQNPFEQVICVDYREKMSDKLAEIGRECLKQVSPSWLVPRLFKLIWTKLRSREDVNSPSWSLATWLEACLEEEELEVPIPGDILLKHAVSFFYMLVQVQSGVMVANK